MQRVRKREIKKSQQWARESQSDNDIHTTVERAQNNNNKKWPNKKEIPQHEASILNLP